MRYPSEYFEILPGVKSSLAATHPDGILRETGSAHILYSVGETLHPLKPHSYRSVSGLPKHAQNFTIIFNDELNEENEKLPSTS